MAFRMAHTGTGNYKDGKVYRCEGKKRNTGKLEGTERGWLQREQKVEAPAMLQHGRAVRS